MFVWPYTLGKRLPVGLHFERPLVQLTENMGLHTSKLTILNNPKHAKHHKQDVQVRVPDEYLVRLLTTSLSPFS